MLLTAPDGRITGFVLVNPKLFGEAAATSMMLELPVNVPPPGTTIVTGKGLRSRALQAELATAACSWSAGAERKRSLIAYGR